MRSAVIAFALAIVLAGTLAESSRSQSPGGAGSDKQIIEEVVRSFATKREIGPVTVAWWQRYEKLATTPREVRLPRNEQRYYATTNHKLVWDRGKFSSSIEYATTADANKLVNIRQEASCDGEYCYVGSLEGSYDGQRATRFAIKEFRKKEAEFSSYINSDYYNVVGILLPVIQGPDAPLGTRSVVEDLLMGGKATLVRASWGERGERRVYRIELLGDNPVYTEARAADLAQLEKNAATATGPEKQNDLDTIAYVKKARELPPKKIYAFELDKEYGFSVVRSEERTLDGKLLVEREMTDFVRLDRNPGWLPRKCYVKLYAMSTTPWLVSADPVMGQRFDATEVNTNPAGDGLWTLNLTKPGTHVADRTFPESALTPDGAVHYVVPAEAEDIDAVIAKARMNVLPRPFWSTTRVVLIAGNFLIIAVCIVLYLRKRRRGSQVNPA